MMNVHLQSCHHKGSSGESSPVSDLDRIGRVFCAIICCCLFSNAYPEVLSLNGASEYPVKFAFLYNFAKFVEWPSVPYRDPGGPLSICIVGHDPFSPDIEAEVRAKTVRGRSVRILTMTPTDTLHLCHMVFVPITEQDQADKIIRGLSGSSTLTVGEAAGFARMGGIINLTVEGSKVHLEINRLAADRAGLQISSKLLSLAKITQEQVSP